MSLQRFLPTYRDEQDTQKEAKIKYEDGDEPAVRINEDETFSRDISLISICNEHQ